MSRLLLLLPLLAACSFLPRGDVDLRAEDHGRDVHLRVGETLSVRLRGNVTTGYRWQVVDLDAELLEQVADEYSSSAPIPGSSGWHALVFRALAPGRTTLRLVHSQPWNHSEAAESFEAAVTIE